MPMTVALPEFRGVFPRDRLKIGENPGIRKDFFPDLENKRENIHKQQEYVVKNAMEYGCIP